MPDTSRPLQGRWSTDNYTLIATGSQNNAAETGALQFVEPLSPLLTGATVLTAPAAFKSSGAVINGGIVVARLGSGSPLVVRGVKNGRVHCELNFFPPSSNARADFWVGDGANLLRNCLLF